MKKFIYTGSFEATDIDEKPVIFFGGNEYELNENNKKVKMLVKLNLLKEITPVVNKRPSKNSR